MGDKNIDIQDLNMKTIKKFLVLNFNQNIQYKNMIYYNNTYEQMDSDTWKKIYELAHLLPVNNKVKELQYKILFRFVATNKLLYQIKIKNTPNCPICEIDTHSIEHLFFECKQTKTFWRRLTDLWNNQNNMNIVLTVKDILLGFKLQEMKLYQPPNIIILLSKSFVIN